MSIMQIKDGVRVSEISRDEVAHLAKLSRLALSEEELAQFATQIDEIVDSAVSYTHLTLPTICSV